MALATCLTQRADIFKYGAPVLHSWLFHLFCAVAQKETEVLTATMAPRHRRVQEAAPIAAIKQCCSCRDDERGRESTPSRLREERVKFLRFVLDPSGRGLFEAPLDPNDVRNASDQLLARVVAEHKDGPDAPGRQRVALLGFEEFRVAYARVIYFYRRNAGVFSVSQRGLLLSARARSSPPAGRRGC